jgi:hypothetical protein
MASFMGKAGWKIVTMAFAIPIGKLATRLTERAWLAFRPDDPPHDPAKSDTAWADAIGWAVVSAVGLAVGRLVATRSAATAWRAVFGVEPPGAEPEEPADTEAES